MQGEHTLWWEEHQSDIIKLSINIYIIRAGAEGRGQEEAGGRQTSLLGSKGVMVA